MHEFDKCRFCDRYSGLSGCHDPYCKDHSDYRTDVYKILAKADELHISVTDVMNLIREYNETHK